jgi:hypothetical protein
MLTRFFCHTYVRPVPVFAVNVTLPPVQNVVGPEGVIVAPGPGAIVMIAVFDVSKHPDAVEMRTRYVPVCVALYVAETAPEIATPFLIHWYSRPVPVFAESRMLPLPQIEPVVGVIAAPRFVTVTVIVSLLLQLF